MAPKLSLASRLPAAAPAWSPRSVEEVLPDVARHQPATAGGRIDRVGMEHIDVPVQLRDASGGLLRVPARADAFVSLDRPDAKGIHMSRLFLALQEELAREELTADLLSRLLHAFVRSHAEISASAHVAIHFDHLVERRALASGHVGWKSYPVRVSGTLSEGSVRSELGFTVTYSSTCPCSAALSRQLVRRRFLETFPGAEKVRTADVAEWLASEEGMCATPHSQRSHAEVRLVLGGDPGPLRLVDWIDTVEVALGTPVQAAVKREDEQAFAALNGSNLMFCEDAARRVRAAVETDPRVLDYRIGVRHEESLHPHDAVSVLCKGAPGGLRA